MPKQWFVVVFLTLLVGSGFCQKAPSSQPSARQVGTVYDLLYGLGSAPSALSPSPFLVQSVRGLKPGSAVDIGSGNGRNSLFLARQGWKVTAVDLSRVGLDQTRMTARTMGVHVHTVARDINQFDFGHNRWNLILLIDFPFAYRALLPRIREGLKPGGWLVLEAVTTREEAELKKHPARPVDLKYTFLQPADLARVFSGFRVLRNEQGFFATPWGGHAWMIRYFVQKPERPSGR